MPVQLFTTETPSFYLISQIYDPSTNPTGQIIPRPGSIVLDPANRGLLQRVVSVHETTFAVTYGPVLTALLAPDPVQPDPSDDNVLSVIDYGNSRFYLFYDKAENPTKLNIDKKVIILGDDAELFEIVRWDTNLHQYIPISMYYDTSGTYRGTKMPLMDIMTTNKAKIPTNCHTNFSIEDEEVYYMFIYDYAGTQCGSVKLYSKRAVVNNAADDTLLIEQFKVVATQMEGDTFYLYPDQDPDSLVMSPSVVYNTGQERQVLIDNNVCYLYGLEGFTAAYPGQTIDLMFKYYLAPTQQAVGEELVVAGSTRYLVKTVKLVVKDPGTNEYSMKVLAVPKYLPTSFKYTLMFYLYTLHDNVVRNITPLVSVTPAFDGRFMGIEQSLMLNFRVRDVFPAAVSDYTYHQPLVIKLAPYDFYERYTLRDSAGDDYGVYGVDSPIVPRPVLYYDESIEKYFIPTNKFGNESVMLESFYYKTRPLYDNSWLPEPMAPTHFTIRDAVTGNILLTAPISVDGYEQGFALAGVPVNHLLGANCIVEFLREQSGQYTVLYGAPVDVYAGTYI